jgi:surfeit locus 1 family protein
MKPRSIIFGIFTAIAAGVCIRLGIWQLHRLDERRAKNADVYARGAMEPLPLLALKTEDTVDTHWRRVTLRGVPDYDAEIVQGSRSQAGAPGVYLLTPVRPLEEGWGDTSILLLRGYVYAPDAKTIDYAKAREADTLELDALVTSFPPVRSGMVRSPTTERVVWSLNYDTITTMLARPLAPVVLLALGDTTPRDIVRPARVPPPSLGEGPHKSYAFQWFGFALVFVVGFVAYVINGRKRAV